MSQKFSEISIKYDLNIAVIKKAFKICKQVGIMTVANFMIGLPGETKEDMFKTVRFANEIDADYARVEFRLSFDNPIKDRDLYLVGAFSDWQYKEEFKLRYKYTSKMYAASILLKQGIYNYLYIWGPDKNGKTDAKICEGSHFNTENDYTVLFYHKAYTNEFDELIGYSRLNSLQR